MLEWQALTVLTNPVEGLQMYFLNWINSEVIVSQSHVGIVELLISCVDRNINLEFNSSATYPLIVQNVNNSTEKWRLNTSLLMRSVKLKTKQCYVLSDSHNESTNYISVRKELPVRSYSHVVLFWGSGRSVYRKMGKFYKKKWV